MDRALQDLTLKEELKLKPKQVIYAVTRQEEEINSLYLFICQNFIVIDAEMTETREFAILLSSPSDHPLPLLSFPYNIQLRLVKHVGY